MGGSGQDGKPAEERVSFGDISFEEQDGFQQPGFADLATFRQGAYRLLAAWLLYPDESVVEIAADAGRFLRQYDELTAQLAAGGSWRTFLEACEAIDIGATAELQSQYMQLFGGSGGYPAIALCESGYVRSSDAVAMVSSDVVKSYRDGGVALSIREVPDHLAVELEYLSILCGQEASAWVEDWDRVRPVLERELRFVRDHLTRWAPAVAQQVAERGTSELYQRHLRAAADLCAGDSALIAAMMESAGTSGAGG